MALAPDRLSATDRPAHRAANGRLGLGRLFTSPGVDPYDEVVWERRDARITNWKDGAVAFEQLGVEFPVGWSVNATNIVAQKYFRGTLGTPERESSLRQVVDRVVDTITTWGREGGYFADEDEAAGVRSRAEVHPRHPAGGVQQPGVVQHRRQGRAAAGVGVLHPVGRRHDGLDPQLVPRGGRDLQGWLRVRASTCRGSAPASSRSRAAARRQGR